MGILWEKSIFCLTAPKKKPSKHHKQERPSLFNPEGMKDINYQQVELQDIERKIKLVRFSLQRTEITFQEGSEGLKLPGKFHFSAIKSILRKCISVQ